MKRDKNFIINSIKMDLHRVVTAAGNLSQEFPRKSVLEFLKHANKDFEKMEQSSKEQNLKKELNRLIENMENHIADPHKRLRWTEKVMDVRNRL